MSLGCVNLSELVKRDLINKILNNPNLDYLKSDLEKMNIDELELISNN